MRAQPCDWWSSNLHWKVDLYVEDGLQEKGLTGIESGFTEAKEWHDGRQRRLRQYVGHCIGPPDRPFI
ncbi:MAG: hypothetical protein ACI8Z1_003264 [Candidatus Azotimanducaceae bacterium]|jgi:hypothetical protein